jgi:ATP-binding cassette subfamily G (WHITE) protein 2 (SNQ2)
MMEANDDDNGNVDHEEQAPADADSTADDGSSPPVLRVDEGGRKPTRDNEGKPEASISNADGSTSNSNSNHEPPFFFSFENLSVHVPGRENHCCKSVHNPLHNFARTNLGVATEVRDPLFALDQVSGYLPQGEMCLVLSSQDLPVTTLLRALCGRLNASDEVSGSILVNGIPLAKSNQGWRRLSPYVSATDASHSPVLTVKETFEFAAQCTSDGTGNPSNKSAGSSKNNTSSGSPEDIARRVNDMMDVLQLSHVADTVVGDENLRGISGGQKRRVTVGEMMFDPNSKFFCLEHITDGLASTDSLSLVQNLSKYCKSHGTAGFASLLQPSDEIVHCFDKLCVLTSDGELAYFGPTDRRDLLRRIFLEPSARNAMVDSGDIADLVLRNTCDPELSASVKQRFRDSKLCSELVTTLMYYRAKAPPAAQRGRAIDDWLPAKKYSTSRWYQSKIIASRRYKLISRNAVTYMRMGVAVFFGVVIGSLFSALGPNLMGALGRTGYLFLNAFLVLMLSAAVTIPASFRERTTLFKHRRAEFFSGRVAYMTQMLLDAPLSILEAVLLSSIGYFWVGMNTNGGAAKHFFFFMACLIGLEFVGQAFGRLLCSLVRKEVSANAVSSVCILIFATVGGFMPPFGQIPAIFRWLSWVTPVSYAFEAMMINEFHDTTIDVISVTSDDGTGETTSLEMSGDTWLAGFGLPRASWTVSLQGTKIFNLVMLFFFATLYDILGAYYIEKNREWDQQLRRPQRKVANTKEKENKKESKSSESKNDSAGGGMEEGEGEADPVKSAGGAAGASSSSWPQTLSVRNIRYEVPFKGGGGGHHRKRCTVQSIFNPCIAKMCGKQVEEMDTVTKEEQETSTNNNTITLLKDVNACFQKGRMVALMGSSGAGKTTLLDVIAGYKTGGTISGDILLDGISKEVNPAQWKQITGYAEQNDILNPYLSVRETLHFTAVCKLPKKSTKTATNKGQENDGQEDDMIQKAISSVARLVSLEPWLDMIVGHEAEGEGLPKHARKCLTIGKYYLYLVHVQYAVCVVVYSNVVIVPFWHLLVLVHRLI